MALQKVDENIELRSARDGVEGLEKLRENSSYVPEYIFLDINMPKMNGLQCLPEIRKLEHLRDAKVIMYSTSWNEDVQQATKRMGANDFLVKAQKLSFLVSDLNRILEKS